MVDMILRAFRTIVRSPIRTVLIVLLLAAGVSFALTSLGLTFAAGDELDKIKRTVGVQAGVSINPDQFARAIQAEVQRAVAEKDQIDPARVGEAIVPLTADQAETIVGFPYVSNIEPFTAAGVKYQIPGGTAQGEAPLQTPFGPIVLPDAIVTGNSDGALLADFQAGNKALVEGRLHSGEDADRKVLVIDQNTAALEELGVGDRLVLRAQVPARPGEGEAPPSPREVEVEIIGIYEDLELAARGGFQLATIEAWYAPMAVVRALQELEDQNNLTAISITYDNVDRAEQLKEDLGAMLDPDLFVVTTTEDRFQDIADPLERMRSTSVLGTVAGLAVVGLIMVMVMALVVRGRLREIGVLKALGARHRQVIGQFAVETIGLALLAVILAVPISLGSNSLIAEAFRGEPSVSVEEEQARQTGPSLGAGARALTAAPVVAEPVTAEEVAQALEEVNVSVGTETIVAAAAVAVGLGLLGALVPIVAVLRLRPAEVLRLEA